MSDPKQPDQSPSRLFSLANVSAVVAVIVALTTIALNWEKLTEAEKRPVITIENRLALPIIVTVNNSTPYKKRVESGARREITLLSEADFPAQVHWEVLRNRNGEGKPLGEFLYDDFRNVDKEKQLVVTNVIGLNTYFYPIIHNNTEHACEIVLNDGLSIKYIVGWSSAKRQTNITGYYKMAKNSNITLYCPHQTYWEGERNGVRGHGLRVSPDSGVIHFYAK